MDNVCHTLVGAALAESGLKRHTALGSATLMIAANFPDIDVIAVPLGHSLGFRRGITHGIAALVVLPVVLTLIMLAWHRWRRRGAEAPKPVTLLLLSTIGILTHPFLDWMNTYGMRWMMPFDPTWWYGDTLFIIDPWIWLALMLGIWFSRRLARKQATPIAPAPARIALAAVGAYIAAMALLGVSARDGVQNALRAQGLTPDTIVVEPVFANPIQRRVIYLWQGSYHLSTYRLFTRGATEPWFAIPLNGDGPALAAANATPVGREYHSWTRLPYYVIEPEGGTTWVSIGDVRYTLNARSSWASVRIPVITDR